MTVPAVCVPVKQQQQKYQLPALLSRSHAASTDLPAKSITIFINEEPDEPPDKNDCPSELIELSSDDEEEEVPVHAAAEVPVMTGRLTEEPVRDMSQYDTADEYDEYDEYDDFLSGILPNVPSAAPSGPLTKPSSSTSPSASAPVATEVFMSRIELMRQETISHLSNGIVSLPQVPVPAANEAVSIPIRPESPSHFPLLTRNMRKRLADIDSGRCFKSLKSSSSSSSSCSPPGRPSTSRSVSSAARNRVRQVLALEAEQTDDDDDDDEDETTDEEPEWLCPVCGQDDNGPAMIYCDYCCQWFHYPCVGIRRNPSSDVWSCPSCLDHRHPDRRSSKPKTSTARSDTTAALLIHNKMIK